jgi:pyridoxamine 5'-phosphate oxidase
MEIGPHSHPLRIFEHWLSEASDHPHIKEPTAFTLATAGAAGMPHARVVLCKSWSEEGFVFYTNYRSQKGQDLTVNPGAAAVFYWDPLHRQVRVGGSIEKTSRQVSEDYWRSRGRDSQLSQYISRQSQEAPSRETLENAWREAESEFAGRDIPCPAHWGGYILRPKTMEFWIGRPGRLHDRHEFEKSDRGWTYRRLYP